MTAASGGSERDGPSERPPIEVSVLGPLRARHDGADVGLGGRRQRAVLARLALAEGATVAAERIVDDLWDGDPPRTAANTLQSYVSNLRRALRRDGETVIERVGDGYRLALPRAALTAARFERLVGAARHGPADADLRRIEEALALWHGPAFGDLAEEAWARADAARLEELRLAAVEARFDLQLASGRHAVAVGDLEAAVRAHPLRERLTAQLVVALYRSGRQADALRALERTRAHLAEELGLEPGPELARLGVQVLEHDPALDPPDAHGASGPSVGAAADDVTSASDVSWTERLASLPLPAAAAARMGSVGRDTERGDLAARWDEVVAGARRLVLVTGEAGMGKTTLAQDLAARVHAAGGTVLWGRSTPDTLLAYQPIVEAIRTATTALGEGATQALLGRWPAVAPLLPSAARPDATRFELYEAVAGLVGDVTAGRPALLVLDDAQWADRSTLSLVRHLLEHPGAGRLLVLATVRRPSGRPTEDLDQLTVDTGRAGTGAVLALDGLAADEVADLLGTRGVTVDDRVADAVRSRTAGNPFFIVSLADQGGDLGAADLAVLPDTVRDVLDQRLAALDQATHATLAAAAVVGPRVALGVLGEVVGREPDEILDAIDAAVAARLLVEEDDIGWVAFPHALVRQALLARTTRNRRAQLHARAADALGRAGAPAAEEAEHLLAAGPLGDAARAASAARRAALAALDTLADDEAVDWVDRGLAVLAPTDHRARAELGLLLARAERRRGDRDAADRAITAMAGEARAAGDPLLLAEAAQERALLEGAVGFSFGEVDQDLLGLLEEALGSVPEGEPVVRAGLLAWSALAVGGSDDLSAVDALSAEALAVAERGDDRHALALALLARRVARQGPPGLTDRLELGPRTTEAAAGWTDLVAVSLVFEVADLMEAGRIDDARRARERLRAVVAPLRRPALTAYVLFVDACWALVEGDVDGATRSADEALAVGGDALGTNGLQAWAGQHYVAARERGDLNPLVGQVEEMVRQLPGLAVWRVALAVCRAAAGDDAGAREAYAPLVESGRLDVGPQSALWYTTVCQLAEVAHLVGDVETCALLVDALAPVAGNITVTGMGAVSLGPCARYLGLARAGAGDLDGAASDLAEAAEVCGSAGFAPWRARALADLADVLDRRGGDGDAATAARVRAEAHDLAGDLGVALGLRTRA